MLTAPPAGTRSAAPAQLAQGHPPVSQEEEPTFTRRLVHGCSQQRSSHRPQSGKNPKVPQLMNENASAFSVLRAEFRGTRERGTYRCLLARLGWACLGREGRQSDSCSVVWDSLRPHGLHSLWNSPGRNTGMGSLCLLQGIFPTQEWNPGLPRCRRILYQLSYKGSPLLARSRHQRLRGAGLQEASEKHTREKDAGRG